MLPRILKCLGAAICGREFKTFECSFAQIVAKVTILPFRDSIARTHDVVRSNGDAAGKRLKHYETKCLRKRGKDEDIGEREPIDEFSPALISDKHILLSIFLF